MIRDSFRAFLAAVDVKFNTTLLRKFQKIKEVYYNSTILNRIRRKIYPLIVRVFFKFFSKSKVPLKLHLGCGQNHLAGYINIDINKTSATDLICDIKKLPYPKNSVKLIETYHAIEHLPRTDFTKALKDWHRIMISGGKLVIECPDFDEIVKKYLAGDDKQLDGIFALQRFEGDYHYFGYNKMRLSRALKEVGFENIQGEQAKDYHTSEWPCLRVVCFKNHN